MAINLDQIENVFSVDYNWVSGRASSQIGGRASNQDSWGALDTPFGFLIVVCDGMGGGPAGELASRIAVDTILRFIKDAKADDARINIVIKAIRKANEAIIQRGVENPMYQGMGSTCIVLLINEQSAIAAYVGDSRIYQLEGRHKKWRTFDHSMVFGLVKQGVITEEQARLSAQSNVITRALGIKLDVEVDAFELPYEKGDRFVLTTDGTHGAMPEPKLIERFANRKAPLKVVLDDLVKDVEKIGITNGGRHDNHTLAIIDVKKKSILKRKMSKKVKLLILCLSVLLCISVLFNIFQYISHRNQVEEQIPMEDNVAGAVQTSASEEALVKSMAEPIPDEFVDSEEITEEEEAIEDAVEATPTQKESVKKEVQQTKKPGSEANPETKPTANPVEGEKEKVEAKVDTDNNPLNVYVFKNSESEALQEASALLQSGDSTLVIK